VATSSPLWTPLQQDVTEPPHRAPLRLAALVGYTARPLTDGARRRGNAADLDAYGVGFVRRRAVTDRRQRVRVYPRSSRRSGTPCGRCADTGQAVRLGIAEFCTSKFSGRHADSTEIRTDLHKAGPGRFFFERSSGPRMVRRQPSPGSHAWRPGPGRRSLTGWSPRRTRGDAGQSDTAEVDTPPPRPARCFKNVTRPPRLVIRRGAREGDPSPPAF